MLRISLMQKPGTDSQPLNLRRNAPHSNRISSMRNKLNKPTYSVAPARPGPTTASNSASPPTGSALLHRSAVPLAQLDDWHGDMLSRRFRGHVYLGRCRQRTSRAKAVTSRARGGRSLAGAPLIRHPQPSSPRPARALPREGSVNCYPGGPLNLILF